MRLLQTAYSTVPLGRAVEINARILPESTDPRHEFRYVDIATVGRGKMVEQPQLLSFERAPSRARRILMRGDVLVSTVRIYLRSVMRIAENEEGLIGSTGFAVLTPPSETMSRYLGWYVQADPFIEDVVARSVGVSYPAISPTELARIPVPAPEPLVQRAIANFLDAETARIDVLVAKKRSMAELLAERDRAAIDMHFSPTGDFATTRLGRMATVGTGLTLDGGRNISGDAVTRPYLRVANVQPGWLNLSEVKEVTVPRYIADRCELRPNDVLMTEGGDIDKLGRALCGAVRLKDVCIRTMCSPSARTRVCSTPSISHISQELRTPGAISRALEASRRTSPSARETVITLVSSAM